MAGNDATSAIRKRLPNPRFRARPIMTRTPTVLHVSRHVNLHRLSQVPIIASSSRLLHYHANSTFREAVHENLLLASCRPVVADHNHLHAADEFRATPDHDVQPNVRREGAADAAWKSDILKRPSATGGFTSRAAASRSAAALMVFQDGHDYVNVKGTGDSHRVRQFDRAREMPPTIAVFINPATMSRKARVSRRQMAASNRSYEYDSLGDRYARFLIEEILPNQEDSSDQRRPEMRAICGASSGGICSFTVVGTPRSIPQSPLTIGSFVNLRGGDAYPALIRKTERKPLRVYLEDSSGTSTTSSGTGRSPIRKWRRR